MFEQLFRFRIIRRKFQRTFYFGASQRRLFLLEINARESGAHHRRIACLQRGLQLFDGIIQLALAARDF